MTSGFTPADPNWEAKVRDSFSRQGAMTTVGARLVHVEPGHVHIALDYADAISQQHGYVHGGVVGMIADTAGGYSGFSLMPADASVLTVEYKLNLVAPADGETILAKGRVIKPGRTLVVTQADVFAIKAGQSKLCATMLQTLMTMTGKSDGRAAAR
ncbi:MAG: hotdog fold thioesterase [Alphaproteobacteria bacterium]|nr:hotdog fold thioesterase [Alphaproteobacteria bacterium]